MATEKERNLLNQLIDAVLKVNASSKRVNVELEINHMSVGVKISDPVEVLANCDQPSNWDWLFYDNNHAYFSDDVFSEEAFLVRCQELIDVVNGFEGHCAQESA